MVVYREEVWWQMRLKDCARCGEDAVVVSSDGKHMARVRRSSKCKQYRAGRCDLSCKTAIYGSMEEAVGEWNADHGGASESADNQEPAPPPRR